MSDFRKQHAAPPGFFAAEAAGLEWLAAPGAIPVVAVLDHGEDFLRLERLEETGPDGERAVQFGRNLARLHAAGAPGFGWAPSAGSWFGPLSSPFSVAEGSLTSFTDFWLGMRLRPLLSVVAESLTDAEAAPVSSALDAIGSGAFAGVCGEGVEEPARVHGDLWSGNLMWTARGGTLIDPAAHGGHRLEDLALLALFGAPFLSEIFSGYESQHPLPHGWQMDLPAHSFFALLAHVRLFGRGFLGRTLEAAETIRRRALALGA